MPATTYCRIVLILRCDTITGFTSGKINNVARFAQSELKDVAIDITINFKV